MEKTRTLIELTKESYKIIRATEELYGEINWTLDRFILIRNSIKKNIDEIKAELRKKRKRIHKKDLKTDRIIKLEEMLSEAKIVFHEEMNYNLLHLSRAEDKIQRIKDDIQNHLQYD